MTGRNESSAGSGVVGWKAKAGIVVLGAVGAVVFNILPLFLGAASDSFDLNDSQLGLLGSAYLGGYAIMIAAGFFWVDRWPWRRTLAAALLAAGGLFCSIPLVEGFAELGILVAACGIALGTVYGLGYPAIARLPNPERLIGLKMAAEALLGTTLLFFLPGSVVAEWGFSGVAIVLGSLSFLALALVPSFPSLGELRESPGPGATATADPRIVLIGLGALGLYTGGMTGVWAFVERLGVGHGFTPSQIGGVLGLSLVVSVGAAFAAAAKGDRGNQTLPHAVALVGLGVAIALWLGSSSLFAYGAGVLLVNGSWFFAFPFQQALATRAAGAERLVMLVPAMAALGAAAGPGLAGALKAESSFLPIYLFGCGASLLGFAGFRFVLRRIPIRPASSN